MKYVLKCLFAILPTVLSTQGGVVVYDISMNTAALVGHPAGPFALEFQLNDGSGTGDGNNTATLSHFVFGGGAPDPSHLIAIGGAAGNAAAVITLTDSSFFNQFSQRFSPGSHLSFRLALTTAIDSGSAPDQFTFAILDTSGTELPTLNPFLDVFVLVDIDSDNPTIRTFGSDPNRAPASGGSALDIAVSLTQPVPEPGTWLLFGVGGGICASVRRRKRSFRFDCTGREEVVQQ